MTATWTTPKTWASELVTSTMLNTHLRDNLDYLKARPVARFADVDGTVISTSSTSFVDVTGASVSITTSGSSRLLILASGTINPGGTANVIYVTADIDGTNQGDATAGLTQGAYANTGSFAICFATAAAVADGAHTVKLRVRVSGGTLSITQASLVVMEVF